MTHEEVFIKIGIGTWREQKREYGRVGEEVGVVYDVVEDALLDFVVRYEVLRHVDGHAAIGRLREDRLAHKKDTHVLIAYPVLPWLDMLGDDDAWAQLTVGVFKVC